jgi:hypothetical protein
MTFRQMSIEDALLLYARELNDYIASIMVSYVLRIT